MAGSKFKNTRSVPRRTAGRYRPPVVPPNLPKGQPKKGVMVVSPSGKKRMI